MKTALNYLLFLLLFNSCIQSDLDDLCPIDDSIDKTPKTKALSFDYESTSNPSLQNNWENVLKITLNGGGVTSSPWNIEEGGSCLIPKSYSIDIKRENGWKLLSHTMITARSADPNYIIFYNELSGVLKVYYYNMNPFNNHKFIWVIESNIASNMLLSNSNIAVPNNLIPETKYASTNNILDQSSFSFSALQPGWNAFSYELAYSPNNNQSYNFIGYNNLTSSIALEGNYSGELVIPITTEDPSGFKKMYSTLESVLGAGSSLFPPLGIVKTAASSLGKVLGFTSLFKSKTNQVDIHATSSGNMNLDGTSFQYLTGAVPPLTNVILSRINDDKDLGLWNLERTPIYKLKKYRFMTSMELSRPGTTTLYDGGEENLSIYDESIQINPAYIDNIKEVKVSREFFTKHTGPNSPYNPTKESENYFLIDSKISFQKYIYNRYPSSQNERFIYFYKLSDPDLHVNITLEILYKDGSSVVSSRNFKAQLDLVDNSREFILFEKNGFTIVIL